MDEIVGDKTAFYISHRLSSCKFCDEIAVFHEGSVIQHGSHAELVADTTGKYHELWNAQAQYYTEKTVQLRYPSYSQCTVGILLTFGVDNEYYRVYNRIKSQEGELTMFRYCFNAVDNKSGNGMPKHTVGLTLSYSF